jgi:hypothetical protein
LDLLLKLILLTLFLCPLSFCSLGRPSNVCELLLCVCLDGCGIAATVVALAELFTAALTIVAAFTRRVAEVPSVVESEAEEAAAVVVAGQQRRRRWGGGGWIVR